MERDGVGLGQAEDLDPDGIWIAPFKKYFGTCSQEKGLNYGDSFQTLTSETTFGEKAALACLRDVSKSSWECLGLSKAFKHRGTTNITQKKKRQAKRQS